GRGGGDPKRVTQASRKAAGTRCCGIRARALSRNAGSATRAVAGQQKLIQAKTDRRNWLLGHAPNPHRDWSRTAQTAKYPLLKRSTRTHFCSCWRSLSWGYARLVALVQHEQGSQGRHAL